MSPMEERSAGGVGPGAAPSPAPAARRPAPRWLIAGAVSITCLIGSLALIGWATDLDTLKAIIPGRVAMNPLTAVCFLAAGTSLWLAAAAPPRSGGTRAAILLGSLIVTVGVVRLSGYLFHVEVGLDALLFRSKVDAPGTFPPNRIAPNTAFCFLLIGAALLTARGSRRAALV